MGMTSKDKIELKWKENDKKEGGGSTGLGWF